MKKRFATILVIMLVFAAVAMPFVSHAFAPVGDINVPYGTPTIDGTMAQGEWSEKNKIVVDKNTATSNGWVGEVLDSIKIDFYYTWDDTNLYLAGVITDPTFAYSAGADNYNGDAFQLSLNLGQIFKTAEHNRAIFYSFGIQEDGILDVFRQESSENGVIENAGFTKKADTGWSFEMKLSWETIVKDAADKSGKPAIAIVPGLKIGALICYMDRDSQGGEVKNAFFTSNAEPGGWDPDLFGITLILLEKAAETTAAAEETTAPAETTPPATTTATTPAAQTADTIIIAASILAIGAAAVIISAKSKKK